MKLFKKPKWLRPEINEFNYWIHIIIIALIVQFVLGLDVSVASTLKFGGAITLADIIAHSVLGFD